MAADQAEVLKRIGARLDAIDAKLAQLLAPKAKRTKDPYGGFVTGAVVASLPVLGGGTYDVRQSMVDELAKLYPAVDVPQTLNEIRGWLIGHAAQRKTAGGMLRFLTTWCAKEQNGH